MSLKDVNNKNVDCFHLVQIGTEKGNAFSGYVEDREIIFRLCKKLFPLRK